MSIAVFGDPQPPGSLTTSISNVWTHVAPRINAANANLNLGLGDYVRFVAGDSTAICNAKFDTFFSYYHPGNRTVYVIGNHEEVAGATGIAVFHSRCDASYGSTTVGALHLIWLENRPLINTATDNPTCGYYGEGDVRNSAQANWLVNQLKALAATPQAWIVVAMHAPIFSTDPTDSWGNAHNSERLALLALFAKYGVDLVLNGDVHNYRRHVEPGNPIYVQAGISGSDDFLDPDPGTQSLTPYDVVHSASYFGWLALTLDGGGPHGRTYGTPTTGALSSFSVIDSFEVPNRTAS